MSMLSSINPFVKYVSKIITIFVFLMLFMAVAYISNLLVLQVIDREKEQLNTYLEIYRHYMLAVVTDDLNKAMFFLEIITPTLYLPLIIADMDDEPIQDYHSYTLNIDELNNLNSLDEQREYLVAMMQKMKANYEPITVFDDNEMPIAKFYYSHSKLVDLLRFFPLITVLVVLSVVMFAYIAFNASKNNEQSKIWVGMSKETAHQLGTPLSSLLAWMELLKLNREQPELIMDTIKEIENDIERLDLIARRFSKIGSAPDLKPLNISKKIDDVVNYYKSRLPNLSGKIEIHKEYPDNIIINANDMLIGWVLENLIKNGVEAMEGNRGDLYLKIEWSGKISSKNKGISNEISGISNETRDISNETRDISNETRDISNETRSISNEISGISNETRSISNETRSISNETRSISNETRDISNETRDISNEIRDIKKIQILITDTGKGMTSKMRYKIFKPGFTTKKRGWGMGLSLVRRIIEDYHNGKIYVKDTAIGKGTTFLIEIPVNKK